MKLADRGEQELTTEGTSQFDASNKRTNMHMMTHNYSKLIPHMLRIHRTAAINL